MEKHAKEIIALAVVMLFAYAYRENPHDEMLKTALVGALGVVTGYYLGGSKVGADTATQNANAIAQAALATGDVQPVEVVNDAGKPVPTVEAAQ